MSGSTCKYICEIVNCRLKAYPKNSEFYNLRILIKCHNQNILGNPAIAHFFPDWSSLRLAFVAKLHFLLSVAYEDTVGRFVS